MSKPGFRKRKFGFRNSFSKLLTMTDFRNLELDRPTDEADNRHPSYRNAALERLERTNERSGRSNNNSIPDPHHHPRRTTLMTMNHDQSQCTNQSLGTRIRTLLTSDTLCKDSQSVSTIDLPTSGDAESLYVSCSLLSQRAQSAKYT